MTSRKWIGAVPAAFPLAFIGLGLALPGLATGAPTHPKILDQAVNAGMKIVREFPAASGLTGWVLSRDGRDSIVYTTADSKTLLAGALIGEDGQSLSDRYEEQFVPKPDLATAYQQLEKSGYVAEGAAGAPKRVIYIFVDPNCPYCHFIWRAVQPYQAAGLQVRWILVATLGPTSLPKAIEVLAARDTTSAFRQMEANHGKPWAAAAQYDAAAHPAIAAAIRRNGELMQAFGVAGTPGVVWRDQHGKVQVKSGMPRLSELPAMTGLPLQKITDPELERFR